jgi:hypothetical protein
VLTEPKNALVKQYKKLFEMENCEIDFTDDALREDRHAGKAKETGARGLRSDHRRGDARHHVRTARPGFLFQSPPSASFFVACFAMPGRLRSR